MTKDVTFQSDSISLSGSLSIPQSYETGVVFLHGGGHSNSTRYTFLQSYFGERDIASLAFDFRGCGKSEGNFRDGSLTNRRADAISALQFFRQQASLEDQSIYLWGSSMGAHVACRIVKTHPFIKGLILQSPAAYGADAESLQLGRDFTSFIRKENSWIDSPAFLSLGAFNGRILVVYGKHDDVVPLAVQHRYKQISQEKGRKVVILHGGAHRLLSPQSREQKATLRRLAEISTSFINS